MTPIKQFKLFFVLTSSDEYNNVTRAARSEVPRSSTQTKIKEENGLKRKSLCGFSALLREVDGLVCLYTNSQPFT